MNSYINIDIEHHNWNSRSGGVVELQSKCAWHLFFVTLGLLFWSLTEWIYSCQHNGFCTLVVSKFYNPFWCGWNKNVFRSFLLQPRLGICRRNSGRSARWNPTSESLVTKRFWGTRCNPGAWFISFSSRGWLACETLNSNGEIIGMKMEKLNSDEAISSCFLIALTSVKRSWRRSCHLFQFWTVPQLTRPFALRLDTSESCFEFF